MAFSDGENPIALGNAVQKSGLPIAIILYIHDPHSKTEFRHDKHSPQVGFLSRKAKTPQNDRSSFWYLLLTAIITNLGEPVLHYPYYRSF